MRALAIAALVVASCGSPAPEAPRAPGDGDIVERAPCPTAPDAATFVATAEAFLRPEMEKAGLAAEI